MLAPRHQTAGHREHKPNIARCSSCPWPAPDGRVVAVQPLGSKNGGFDALEDRIERGATSPTWSANVDRLSSTPSLSQRSAFVAREGIDFIAFEKGQRKEDVTQAYLRKFKQNHKEGEALRTKPTINDTRDFVALLGPTACLPKSSEPTRWPLEDVDRPNRRLAVPAAS
jgi:hypothetical protein